MPKREPSALIVFAREPQLGKVKTRLQPHLNAPLVLRLYKAFVQDVLQLAIDVNCDERFLFYTGGRSLPFLGRFRTRFVLKRQQGRDLGERMLNAFRFCRQQGYGRIVIIGTDCLSLTKGTLAKAFRNLSRYPCVIGPSRDGGYYLLGLRRPHAKLFQQIRWSSEQVTHQTLQRARSLKLKVALLAEKEDIDNVRALQRMANRAPVYRKMPRTLQMIQRLKR